jgi:hypothetical protein
MNNKPGKYFLATYELLDGEHEHTGALIIQARTSQEAEKIATDEEHSPETPYTAEDQEEGRVNDQLGELDLKEQDTKQSSPGRSASSG